MTEPELAVADLGRLGELLGKGGQALVFDAPDLTLPDAPGPLVYKQYRDGYAPRPHDMSRLVRLRTGLTDGDRDRLDGITTWPLRLVVDGAAVRGVVLPRIPASYFQPVTTPSGRPGTWVREIQHLFVDPARSRRVGMPEVSPEQRLTICRDFAAALDFLHGPAMDVVFGDINAKNELFRLGAEPTVMLVDCDAVRKRGDVTGGAQLNAPDWEPPHTAALNRATDRYKLGLFVLRCLIPPGPQTSTRRDAGAAAGILDGTGMALLTSALADDPHSRPSAREWLRFLSRLLGRPLDPPKLNRVAVARTLVAAGEPLTVHWTATDAITVEVTALGTDAVVADARAGEGSVEIHPVRTGRLTVTVRNPLGEDSWRTRPVAVLDVPDWSRLPVLLPALSLDAVALPALPDVRPVLALAPPLPVFTAPAAAHPVHPPAFPPPVTLPGLDLGDPGPVDVLSIMLPRPESRPGRKNP